MLKKLIWLIVGIPVAVVLIAVSVANRQPVTLRLDPFNSVDPALVVTLPFFVFLFVAVLVGVLIGGFFSWLSQSRFRKLARSERTRANKKEQEAAQQRARAETLAQQNAEAAVNAEGFPLIGNKDRAA
ncbi:MAG: LapA family protein [Rhizobiaceae bacterium]